LVFWFDRFYFCFNDFINYFLGRNTSNFTSINKLFLNYLEINLWRFEVVYTFEKETGTNALNFKINPKLSNVTCSIDPLNGTTNTLFNITCSNWYKEDNIKDYSLYSMLHIFLKKTNFYLN
jgi:hypothetical protein